MNATPDRRIVVITGASSGIGKAAAVRFAADGQHVILACRDPQRGRRALQQVIDASGSRAVELLRVDVASFDSVRRFCDAFRAAHDRLDTLIHNAGYFEHGLRTYQTSPDGLELTFATNVFGPLLMTELLLDRLQRSADARVLWASSTNIKNFFDPKREIQFDNLRGEHRADRPYSVYRMYGDSKMGQILLTRRMAEVYAPLGIRVNAIMIPATRVEKATLRKFHSWYRVLGLIVQNLNPWALAPEQIAACYHRICTAPECGGVTGALIDRDLEILRPLETGRPLSPAATLRELRHPRHTPPYADDPANIERMWRLAREVIDPALEAAGDAPATARRL